MTASPEAELESATIQLDLSGLNCPLPVLKTKAALARMQPGDELQVLVTHPDSVREFEVLCRGNDLELVDFRQSDSSYRYLIRKLL